MTKKILVPLDGSPRAESILPMVRTLARRSKIPTTLLPYVTLGFETGRQGFLFRKARGLWMDAGRYLYRIVRDLVSQGCRARGVVGSVGRPAQSILLSAAAEEVDAIAMTTRGRKGPARWIMGSTAETVIRNSPVPTLTLKDGVADRWTGHWKPRRILLSIDESGGAARLLNHVADLAESFESEITLLHVVPPGESVPEGRRRMETWTNQARTLLAGRGIDLKPLLVTGNVFHAIRTVRRQGHMDLIAMRTRGRTGFARWFHGSLTESLLRSSRVPFLTMSASPDIPESPSVAVLPRSSRRTLHLVKTHP